MGEQCYNLPSQRTRDGKQLPWCKEGDQVFFGQYAGSRVLEHGCDDLIIINDEDIKPKKKKEFTYLLQSH